MGVPPMSEFYRKCFASGEEKDRDDLLHPSRLINFLVGMTGKNETMGIGGSWSPSLDGPNPQTDPKVLIRTAIRTCKALTGIDLSECSKWYVFDVKSHNLLPQLFEIKMESVDEKFWNRCVESAESSAIRNLCILRKI